MCGGKNLVFLAGFVCADCSWEASLSSADTLHSDLFVCNHRCAELITNNIAQFCPWHPKVQDLFGTSVMQHSKPSWIPFLWFFFFFCEALEAVGYLITSGSAQISLLMLNPKLAAVANWFLWDCLHCTDIPDTNSIFQRAKET